MNDLTQLINKWKNSNLEFREAETLINLLIVDNDRMQQHEESIDKIKNWIDAYPLNSFPEPDFKKAARILKENDMTLDSISSSNMRHVLNGLKGIIDS